MVSSNDSNKMQQRKQQLESITEREEPANTRDDPNFPDEHQDDAEEEMMNHFDDTAYTNRAPHEQEYDGIAEWPLSPGPTSPSPIAVKLFSGYTFPGIGTVGDGACGISAMDMDYQPTTSLTREEQQMDSSYTMLICNRNALSTATADGKIQEPHLNDVLCGRGGSINSHPGNRIFREWIAHRKESYMLADSKSDKSSVTAEIFQQVREQNPPGRFLQKVTDSRSKSNDPYNVGGWWAEIDDAKALAKISQALREGAPAFRALHGKKGRGKKQQTQESKRSSTRRSKQNKNDSDNEVSPRDKRKAPPDMELSPAPRTPLQEVVSIPPASSMRNTNGRELDVLFSTTNNFFATENGNGSVLNSYPLVHMNDYTASLNDVARAIPTPPTAKKPRASVPPSTGSTPTSGNKLQPTVANTVSPGFSPYGEAKAAWDAIAFLPNLSPAPGNHSPLYKKPSLQRFHSLSFSDADVQSIGSFENPFQNDNGNNHKEEPLDAELEAPHSNEDPNTFPPPLASPQHGLSFGRIGSVPGVNNHQRNSRPMKPTSRRGSSLSSKSWGSISNFNNHKRKSIG